MVIDLDRLPSNGRGIAVALRRAAGTRRVPLVFAGGAEDKVARARAELPDAAFASWRGFRGAIARAITGAPARPLVPTEEERYAGRTLAQKLGVAAGVHVALVGAPPGFAEKLAPLPAGARVSARGVGEADLVLWFVRRKADLGCLPTLSARARRGLWIAWAKRSARVATDVTEAGVRAAALAHGLVDFKICAIDATWSGMRFARRRTR